MKLPRDVSGDDLSGRLSLLGYAVVRQSGSHMRLVRTGENQLGIVSLVFGSVREMNPIYTL